MQEHSTQQQSNTVRPQMTREIWALATQDVPTNLAMTLFLDLILAAVFVAC